MTLVPVILSGGAGTRLWPLSRELLPKQLLALTGERTMIQETAARLAGFPDATGPVVVCNEAHRFLVAEQLREMGMPPAGHPARAGRAQHRAGHRAGGARGAGSSAGEDALLLVLPADHALQRSRGLPGRHPAGDAGAAAAGKLVAFGIVARTPETGYGYIRRGAGQPGRCAPIAQFVEKPDLARAREFIASGEYFWNSGMFMFGARRFLDELAQSRAGHRRRLRARQRHGGAREGFHARRRGGVRHLPQRFGRLRGHGKNSRRGHGAARCGLERRRFLGRAARRAAGRRARQRRRAATCCSRTPTDCYVHADSRLVAALGLA